MPPPPTRIRRVRARLSGRDPFAARQGLERLLVASDFTTHNLSPNAILCVRHFRDPLPGVLVPQTPHVHPPSRWQEACQEQLARFAADAAHPARAPTPVPADTPSVLFANEAELLAALAVAALTGRLHAEWWWPGLLSSDETEAWIRRWIRRSQTIPAAVQCLASTVHWEVVRDQLPAACAREMLASLRTTYALPTGPVTELSLPPAPPRHAPHPSMGPSSLDTPSLTTAQDQTAFSQPPSPRRIPRPPVPPTRIPPSWLPFIPELTNAVSPPESRAFLATALLLARAPQFPRHPTFPDRLRNWVEASPLPAVPVTPTDSDPSDVIQSPSNSLHDTSISDPIPTQTTDGTTEIQDPECPLTSKGSLGVHAKSLGTTVPYSFPSEIDSVETNAGLKAAQELAPVPVPIGTPVFDRFTTVWGGTFYFLNIALFLELYPDFTRPLDKGLILSPWDLLSLIGRAAAPDGFDADPLAARLLSWVGHPDTDARQEAAVLIRETTSFRPPASWLLPGSWLAPFGSTDDLSWNESRGWLVGRHPLGFTAAQVPRLPEPFAQQVARVSERIRTSTRLETSTLHPSDPTTTLDRWLGWLLPYLETRVTLALGLPTREPVTIEDGGLPANRPSPDPSPAAAKRRWERVVPRQRNRGRTPLRGPSSESASQNGTSTPPIDPSHIAAGVPPGGTLPGSPPPCVRGQGFRSLALLLRQPAVVETSGTHLRVRFDLRSHPIAVRLAGLDRDPGWIPAAGHSLSFHYE